MLLQSKWLTRAKLTTNTKKHIELLEIATWYRHLENPHEAKSKPTMNHLSLGIYLRDSTSWLTDLFRHVHFHFIHNSQKIDQTTHSSTDK